MPFIGSAPPEGGQQNGRPPGQQPPRPWRAEGLPNRQPPKKRSWWIGAIGLLAYLVPFALLTLQDWMSGPQTISYTELKAQVAAKNVGEVFARGNSIEGALRKPAHIPGVAPGSKPRGGDTYQKFTTERPTFAADDLLAELMATGATVRATPVVQQRGILTNLLLSVAPFLLLPRLRNLWVFNTFERRLEARVAQTTGKRYRSLDQTGVGHFSSWGVIRSATRTIELTPPSKPSRGNAGCTSPRTNVPELQGIPCRPR